MNSVTLPTLSFLFFLAASVYSQSCVDETLDCSEPVPTVFKLADASCPCNNPTHAGALKYVDGKVYVCSGSKWKTVQFNGAYGTENNPGSSCKDIQDNAGQQLSDGIFWIRLRGTCYKGRALCRVADETCTSFSLHI